MLAYPTTCILHMFSLNCFIPWSLHARQYSNVPLPTFTTHNILSPTRSNLANLKNRTTENPTPLLLRIAIAYRIGIIAPKFSATTFLPIIIILYQFFYIISLRTPHSSVSSVQCYYCPITVQCPSQNLQTHLLLFGHLILIVIKCHHLHATP